MPFEHAAAHNSPVYITKSIDPHTFGATVDKITRLYIFQEVMKLTSESTTDSNTLLPSRIIWSPRFRISHVNRIGGIDINAARSTKLMPVCRQALIASSIVAASPRSFRLEAD